MIRAQIDPSDALGGKRSGFWLEPTFRHRHERIALTLAATLEDKIAPLVELASNSRRDIHCRVYRTPRRGRALPVRFKVFESALQGVTGRTVDVPRTFAHDPVRVPALRPRPHWCSLLISETCLTMSSSNCRAGSQNVAPRSASAKLPGADRSQSLLAKRKQTTPSSVMLARNLISRALPDSTYVTELRIEGDKVQGGWYFPGRAVAHSID